MLAASLLQPLKTDTGLNLTGSRNGANLRNSYHCEFLFYFTVPYADLPAIISLVSVWILWNSSNITRILQKATNYLLITNLCLSADSYYLLFVLLRTFLSMKIRASSGVI